MLQYGSNHTIWMVFAVGPRIKLELRVSLESMFSHEFKNCKIKESDQLVSQKL